LNNMKIRFKSSIRNKLYFGFLFVVIFTGAASLVAGYRIINREIINQAYETVRSDLRTAQYIYNKRLYQLEMTLNYISTLDYVQRSITERNRTFIMGKFSKLKSWIGADIIIITDNKGNVIKRVNNRNIIRDNVMEISAIRKTIETGKLSTGAGILSPEILKREGSDIARGAVIKIVPTSMGRVINQKYEERALVLNTAIPVFSNGTLAGVIYGAKIVNNQFDIVDRIKYLLFRTGKDSSRELGAATFFLDDIRVSTNVYNQKGERTVGTQVSSQVYTKVITEGVTWLDRAFVVNKWHLAGYAPIHDVDEKIVGMLYVGIPQDRFDRIKVSTTSFFLFTTIITALLAGFIAVYLVKRIIHPINEIVDASKEIGEGNYNRKIQIFHDDEMGYLARAFNSMIDAIQERDFILRENTQKQIVQSEKLASLGRLASGIAHEINNPLTGILTYSSMMKEDLKGSQYEEDLDVIIDETMRCRKIVREVLDFARETKLEKQVIDLNHVILSAISILEKHFAFRNINIIKNFSFEIPEISADLSQIKSVINNLAVNAADAMPAGGDLIITTGYDPEEGMVIIKFQDMGTGISEENIGKIFDPFFTTKEPGKGTGLGLAVIYGIVEGHSGRISVDSVQGEGTTFTIKLPVE